MELVNHQVLGELVFALPGSEGMAHVRAEPLMNTKPIGMAGGPTAQTLPFDEASVDKARVIFDMVALPSETSLIRYAKS